MEKKVPIRTCIACRTSKPKSELMRIVKFNDEISLDLTGKKNGRGAYVCKCKNCLEKLKKSKLLNRAFSCEIDNSVYDLLIKEFNESNE